MTFNEAKAEVQELINNTTPTVTNMISNSLKFLNNIFSLRKWDSSETTTVDQNYVDISSLEVLDVLLVYIDGEEIQPLDDDELINIPKFEDEGVSRWYFSDEKIYFTVAPTSTGDAVKIFYKKRFTIPTADESFDSPREYDELIILGAVARYYGVLLSTVVSNREDEPDVDANEIRRAKKEVQNQYDELKKEIKANNQNAI